MSFLNTIQNRSKADHKLAKQINDDCPPIGGIYHLDYSRAIVLTDDFRKSEAGGVPLGGFLLAAAGDQTEDGFILTDDELILLRVRGTAPLPNEAELVQTRLAVVRDATNSGRQFDEVTDVLTRNELQQSAFDCEVIGTFYTDDDRNATVEFGADVDNVIASAKYQVFLPSKGVLSWLASFSDSTEDGTVTIGTVRFSSTRRRARAAGTDTAAVDVHVDDFISRKTAVFGMTRTGKSNTIKTLATAVHKYASEHQEPIGQLIFDPQGEYAAVNKQDNTGLKLLGDADSVRIYRMGADDSDPQVKPLAMDFYDIANFTAVTEFVNDAVTAQYGQYANVKTFAAIKWDEPPKDERSEHTHWERARIGMYGILYECGFRGGFSNSGKGTGLVFTWDKSHFADFDRDNPGLVQLIREGGSAYRATSPRAAHAVTLFMMNDGSWDTSSSGQGDKPFKHIGGFLSKASGPAAVRSLREFHSAHSDARVEDLIWDDMAGGRLAIVDLAHGSGEVPRIISENIVNHLLSQANTRFRDGDDPIKFQIVVEEAHNLFERGAKEVSGNPWVRLSKEAAKYKIGLVYATQEVSSVDQRILSNTSNWIVAHLNSDKETHELSHYYDFKTWADSIRRCEDVGFVRMKTYSGKYIVPVQIAKFDHAMINAARRAAGLPPVAADGSVVES
ncbi:ATP-binding protein [Tsukamurella soli]|uniref:DUF87 domain-containing protein n=1 Tax=Tsukamurella soli TaxID=644556 RepID=A0ABP8J775_9ACTN